tara:strand:- start:14 stop:838 length:825 start_codon:yes stop_codon:yes gene_type:complete
MDSGIYKIENTVNKKVYIGLSTCLSSRFKTHLSSLKRNKHPNNHLQNSWNKYGKDAFKISVLEYCLDADLSAREIYFAEYHELKLGRTLYNLTPCGGRPPSYTGRDNKSYDFTLHTFYHEDGTIEKDITQADFSKKHNVKGTSAIVRGLRTSIAGWRTSKEKYWVTVSDYYHFLGKEELKMEQKTMCRKYNLNAGDVSSLNSGRSHSVKGWTLSKEAALKYKANRVTDIVDPNGNLYFNLTRSQIVLLTGFDKNKVQKLFTKKITSIKGWKLKP